MAKSGQGSPGKSILLGEPGWSKLQMKEQIEEPSDTTSLQARRAHLWQTPADEWLKYVKGQKILPREGRK